MSKPTVAVIVGSLRKESFNLQLAKAIVALGADKFDAKFVNIGAVPLYNQDLEADFPAAATQLKKEISEADAVLFVTPEYNRSIPGPLKNAIDWASRPYGKNAFAGKPAAVIGTSQGSIGTACAQQALIPVLGYLETTLMRQPEVYFQFKDGVIGADGTIADDKTKAFLQGFADKFAAWVQHHTTARAKAA